MITDDDIKKLAAVFTTKNDFLVMGGRMSSLEDKFEDLLSAVNELKSEVQKGTDSIIKEFLEVYVETNKNKERVNNHEKHIKHFERRFQKIKLSID